MTPSSTQGRISTSTGEHRYRPSGAAAIDYLRRVDGDDSSQHPIYHGHAGKNIRRHLSRFVARILGLLAVDLAAFELLRVAMPYVRSLPGGIGEFVTAHAPPGYLAMNHLGAALIVGLVLMGCYGPADHRRDVRQIVIACAFAALLPLWHRLWIDPFGASFTYVVVTAVLALTISTVRVTLDTALLKVAPRPTQRVVLVGPGTACLDMMGREEFETRQGMHFVAFVDTSRPDRSTEDAMRDVALLLAGHEADTVMLCGHVSEDVFASLIQVATVAEAQILTTSRLYALTGIQPNLIWRDGQPFIELRAPELRGQQLLLKRTLDFTVAAIALLVLSPVMAACAIAVRMDSNGPAVFGQRRLGRFGRSFKCYKFRSMHTDSEQRLKSDPELYDLYVKNDYKLPPELDPRVTKVGAFLRKTSLDELPQLWNVLRGNMSLVGPRPIVPDEIRHYEHEAPLLLLVKPGVTGSWQVSGRSDCVYPERTNVELEYVREWSLGRDISILLRTVPAVLFQRGAH